MLKPFEGKQQCSKEKPTLDDFFVDRRRHFDWRTCSPSSLCICLYLDVLLRTLPFYLASRRHFIDFPHFIPHFSLPPPRAPFVFSFPLCLWQNYCPLISNRKSPRSRRKIQRSKFDWVPLRQKSKQRRKLKNWKLRYSSRLFVKERSLTRLSFLWRVLGFQRNPWSSCLLFSLLLLGSSVFPFWSPQSVTCFSTVCTTLLTMSVLLCRLCL